MKKFNFFPVLLVALFMFCGFDSNAQVNYKSAAEALVSVQSVVDQSQTTLEASTAVSPAAGQNLAQMIIRIELGNELMPKIKQSQNVAKSLDEMYAKYVANDVKTAELKAGLDHIKSLLII